MDLVQAKLSSLILASLLVSSCCRHPFGWQKFNMDAHRTGVSAVIGDGVEKALGTIDDSVYVSPSGNVYPCGSSTYAVAAAVLASQPRVAYLKEDIGRSSAEMVASAPESALSNWIADRCIEFVQSLTGRHVDVSIANFGGIRADMPSGDILLDDIISMFPFKNCFCYVALKGSDLEQLFRDMAARKVQIVGGVRLVVSDGQLDTLLVDGEPVDPEKIYGVGTIDFLLDGGDGIFVARNAQELIITERLVRDAFVEYIRRENSEGREINYCTDGRVVVK